MRDRLWQQAHDALLPLLSERDVVLAPQGDWPPFPCACTFYDDVIEIADCTVFLMHKGRLGSVQKPDLGRIAREWQWIFANNVFVVFSRSPKIRRDIRFGFRRIYCLPIVRFLRSASLRKRRSRIVYIHVPKTGGTSMWRSLRKAFPSHVYYSSIDACLKNPPAPDDYDLIGGHFSPSVVANYLLEDDCVVGMVRDPTERFLSGVVHSRRGGEDPATFSPSMQAMRSMDLADYLATDFGRRESRLQLIMFGTDHRRMWTTYSEGEMLASALAFARRDNVLLGPSERSADFSKLLARRFAFRPRKLSRLNANNPKLRSAYLPEFARAMQLIKEHNKLEYEFYDYVCRSFAEAVDG
jgi:Sulfotransferase family